MIDNHKLVNLDAECAVLGSILVHNKVIERCSDFLESEHFADPVNGRIYEACLSIIRNGEEATPSSINRHLKEIEKCQDEEIEDFLVRLKEQTVTCLNARDYALQIFNLASRRLIVAVLDKYREELMGIYWMMSTSKLLKKLKTTWMA